MVLLQLILLSFIILLFIIILCLIPLCVLNFQQIQKCLFNKYRKINSDKDLIIVFWAVIVLVMFSIMIWVYPAFTEKGKYDKSTLTLQSQLFAVILACVAAYIAFKNYRRKSGHELYYNIFGDTKKGSVFIKKIRVYNSKDKASIIFAIDVLFIDSNKRLRLFQDHYNPLIIPSYSCETITLEETMKYSDGHKIENFNQENITFICITYDQSIIAKKANLSDLNKDFRDQCIFPLSALNLPDWDKTETPINATHYATIRESYYDDEFELYEMAYSDYVVKGFFQDDIFYVFFDSKKDEETKTYKSYLHKKTREEINSMMIADCYNGFEEGEIGHYPGYWLMHMEKINYQPIKKI